VEKCSTFYQPASESSQQPPASAESSDAFFKLLPLVEAVEAAEAVEAVEAVSSLMSDVHQSSTLHWYRQQQSNRG
jgi:hypothetical protein